MWIPSDMTADWYSFFSKADIPPIWWDAHLWKCARLPDRIFCGKDMTAPVYRFIWQRKATTADLAKSAGNWNITAGRKEQIILYWHYGELGITGVDRLRKIWMKYHSFRKSGKKKASS